MNAKDTLICIVLIALTLYACASVAAVGGELRAAAAVQQELSAELERLARERLGLVKPGDKIFYFTTDREG